MGRSLFDITKEILDEVESSEMEKSASKTQNFAPTTATGIDIVKLASEIRAEADQGQHITHSDFSFFLKEAGIFF